MVLLGGSFGVELILPGACVLRTQGNDSPLPLKILLFSNLWKVII